MTGIAMLVNEFPPVTIGGAERQAERLAEFLGSLGLTIGVVTRGATDLPSFEQRANFWVERVPQRGPGKLKTLSFMAGAIAVLWRRRHEYDILHAHLAFAPALVASMISRSLGKRVIVKYGSSGIYGDVQTSQRTLRGRLRLAILRRYVDAHIALSAEMEAELLAAGFSPDRVLRMANGIDAAVFRPMESKGTAKAGLGLADKTVALFIGRLATQKSLPTLLLALRQAIADCPQLHLLLVGDGPEGGLLERRVSELGIASHVTFVGSVNNVQPYLNAADMFVLPSTTEGISNALLEAMTMEVACVATAVGGSPEVLEDGACGVLLPPERPDLLSAAMVRLALNPDEATRLGQAARNRILSHYDFAVVAHQYRALYERLLARTVAPEGNILVQLGVNPSVVSKR